MCNLIQSFYSKNCSDFNMFVQSCYFALSAIYANENDMPIKLYTDTDFKEVLKSAPYKEITVLFDNCDEYKNIDPLIWAWPKFVALDVVPRDHIHIDGDVFLKSKSCKELLDFKNHDAIVQHLELGVHDISYQKSWEQTFDTIKHFDCPKYIDFVVPKAMPNNGVLGVNNEYLWNLYKETYWYMVDQAVPGSINTEEWTAPDIIFEQYFLKQICDKFGYNIKYVLEGNTVSDINKDAIGKKYQHVCVNKVTHLKKCLSVIKSKDLKCYDSLKTTWFCKFPEYFE